MRNRNLLFFEGDLADQLRSKQEQAHRIVHGILEEQFLISSDREILDYTTSELTIEAITLREDLITMTQSETQVDVSDEPTRIFPPGHRGPFFVAGTRIDVNVPFDGDEWLFHYRTSSRSTVFPHAEVSDGTLHISISLAHDVDRNEFKALYEREIGIIKKYIEWSRSQVDIYNEGLPQLVSQAIANRRERLKKHADIASLLDIPISTKKGAPLIAPVKVEIRQPPMLPVPPRTGLKPEPGIKDETYEKILQFIRHQGRTFETAPATFAMHGEEGLRDIILAQLNGYFQGDAAGEVFRRRGKTDIRIEQGDRAAFVGECKLWTGSTDLARALEQLLGYLTWRDSKASVIVFNAHNKNFSNIRKSIPKTVEKHPLFLRDIRCEEVGEWRIQTRSKEDEGRRVTIHIFAFDLYQDIS